MNYRIVSSALLSLLATITATATALADAPPPLVPGVAAASAPARDTAEPTHPKIRFGFEGWLGGGASNSVTAASEAGLTPEATIGFMPSVRWQWLKLGLTAELGSKLLASNDAHFGLAVGPVWEPTPRIRVEALLEGGDHTMYDIGSGLFNKANGTDSLPYAGARASVSGRFGRGRRGIIGGWVSYREDLGRDRINVLQTSCFFDCSTSSQQYKIGGDDVQFGLRIGFER